MRQTAFCFSFQFIGLMSAMAAEIPPGGEAFVHRAAIPPVLDGRLDDACWREAVAITNFTQVLPREGEAPTERTEVRFAFDARNLYIAVRCFDTEPTRVIARELQRDAIDGDEPFLSDDHISLALDPFHRGHDGYLFAVNPLGALADGRIENTSYTRLSWNTLAQYDNDSDTFGVNSRIRWTVRPGTDIYLVWNQGYDVEDDRQFQRTLTEVTLKGGLTWRF